MVTTDVLTESRRSARLRAPVAAERMFRLTGAPGVEDGTGRRTAPKGMTATLMTVLLLRANHVVDSGVLVGLLWQESEPQSAKANLRQYVSKLRRFLAEAAPEGGSRLRSIGGGYLLEVRRSELDVTCFEDLSDLGRRALEAGEVTAARAYLEASIELWSGPLCQGVALAPELETEVHSRQDLWLATHQMLVRTRIQVGDYGHAIAEVRQLLVAHPLSEDLWGMLMLALYRSYRRGEALEAFRAARGLIVRELGIEPTPQLQRLHQSILSGDCPLEGFDWP
ncbi:AfsR/SARP family transcriptional regulator [Streptomyces sp. PRKS01-29]|nr:AfsR/SARP family transcriptional regulator [Streptomyces sabulosicollis]MBI0293374.1 AfsR/SARP family transcriptional regulator [Streptomyces sabulosicollis]